LITLSKGGLKCAAKALLDPASGSYRLYNRRKPKAGRALLWKLINSPAPGSGGGMRAFVIAIIRLAYAIRAEIAVSRYETVKTEILNNDMAQLNAAKGSQSDTYRPQADRARTRSSK
jgi:hypothetical protein